ncbi:hypothetical protein DIURU_004170 [Diutina rugosa]|uniref:DNA-directed RNA polymerase I subunit RPA34 n=1 Tax=Diutina rugosa TaxID=5481 RepID=A0A642UIC5_DIURU|nr:uncharacterized protein DIURU_004170 [Diutina rugosa]KAA8899687.1 hypothetical protein DIURU_004170 [Diutina rugosa]
MVIKSKEYVSDSDSENDEFEPPKGFKPQQFGADFAKAAKDKEIWLIKAPKGFDMNELKKLPVSFTATSLKKGPTPFTQNDVTYTVNEELLTTENAPSKYTVLAGGKTGGLVSTSAKINRFYNIRETVSIPKIDFDAARVPRKDVEEVEGLRMRHFPTGYDANDFEEAKAPAQSESSKKRSADTTEDAQSTKKSKKDKSESGDKDKEKKKKKKSKKQK